MLIRTTTKSKEFDTSGNRFYQFGPYGTGNGQFSLPSALTFDSSGNLWVADYGNNRVEEFAVVPEPSSIALLCTGAIALLAYGSRESGLRAPAICLLVSFDTSHGVICSPTNRVLPYPCRLRSLSVEPWGLSLGKKLACNRALGPCRSLPFQAARRDKSG